MKKGNVTVLEVYEDLAIAIIVNAANDYRKVLKKLEADPFNVYLLIERAEIEQFFRSQWYECLTTVDGTMILRRLQNGE